MMADIHMRRPVVARPRRRRADRKVEPALVGACPPPVAASSRITAEPGETTVRNRANPALDRTRGIVDECQPSEATVGATGRWLGALAHHLRPLWRSALASDTLTQRWAACSEHHPNEFVKFVLQEWPDGSRLRLHVWQRRSPRSDVHNHRWDFVSMPLVGSFQEHLYEIREGNGVLLSCNSTTADDGVHVQVVGSAGVARVATLLRPAGVPYDCDLTSFHSFTPEGTGLAASLVYRGSAASDLALVWRPSATGTLNGRTVHIPTPPLSIPEVRLVLSSLLAHT